MKNKKILIIGPHTDDIEICMGGSTYKLNKQNDVYYVTFSFAEKSIPKEFSPESTRIESNQSTSILGIQPDNIYQFNYDVRSFSYYRQEILEDLIKLRNKINPDIIFTTSITDIHQDHNVISYESIRAFRDDSSIFCYETPRNNIIPSFNPQLFIELCDNDVDKKTKSILMFESQIYKQKNDIYDVVISHMKYRGNMIRKKYAECFEVIRMVL